MLIMPQCGAILPVAAGKNTQKGENVLRVIHLTLLDAESSHGKEA